MACSASGKRAVKAPANENDEWSSTSRESKRTGGDSNSTALLRVPLLDTVAVVPPAEDAPGVLAVGRA